MRTANGTPELTVPLDETPSQWRRLESHRLSPSDGESRRLVEAVDGDAVEECV